MQPEAGGIGRFIALPMASADPRPKAIVSPRPCSLSRCAGSNNAAIAGAVIAFDARRRGAGRSAGGQPQPRRQLVLAAMALVC